jgi:hypothetical protein
VNVIREKKHANKGCEPFGSTIYYEFYIGDGFIVNINETNLTSILHQTWQFLTAVLFHSIHSVLIFMGQ